VIRRSFSLLTLTLLWIVGVSAQPLDYFEVTNPNFEPLRVGLESEPANSVEALYLQAVLKNNIEPSMFFLLEASSERALSLSEGPDFHIQLSLKGPARNQVRMVVRERGRAEPIIDESRSRTLDRTWRSIGLEFSEQFIQKTLGFSSAVRSQVAFTAQTARGRKNIMLIQYDGTQLRRFSYNLGTNNLAQWSFDNRQLLYVTFTRSSAQLQLQPSHRLQARILSFPARSQPLAGSWHPDHQNLLITLVRQGNSDIFEHNLQTGTLRPLITGKGLEASAVWSPDGSRIAYVSDQAKSNEPQLYLFDPRTRSQERITFKGNYNSSPRWSPDGRHLAYEGKRRGYFQIFKYDLERKQHQQLTFERYDTEKPDWSPNGQQLVVSSRKSGVPKLYYLSAYGGRLIRVTTNPPEVSETNPVWSH
jgi:TolB protein